MIISTGLTDCYTVNDNFQNIRVKSSVSNKIDMFYFNAVSDEPAFLSVDQDGGVRRQHDGCKQTKLVTFRNMTPRRLQSR